MTGSYVAVLFRDLQFCFRPKCRRTFLEYLWNKFRVGHYVGSKYLAVVITVVFVIFVLVANVITCLPTGHLGFFDWTTRQGLFGTKETLYLTDSYKARGDGKPTDWSLIKYAKPLRNSPNNNKISVQDMAYKHCLKTDIRIRQRVGE